MTVELHIEIFITSKLGLLFIQRLSQKSEGQWLMFMAVNWVILKVFSKFPVIF